MGQDEDADSGFRGEAAGLGRRHVPVLGREPLVRGGERGLADQHVDPRGEFEGGVAQPGVHDERELLTGARLADLVEAHRSVR
jgi:hypothetical protein